MTDGVPSERPRWRRWVARFGVAGALFFLVKGILWLTVPGLVFAKACG